jgi:hypothetical protein
LLGRFLISPRGENSTGRELSQADLIRNFILMGLEPVLQTRLYQQFWRPMELAFGQEAYGTHFDAFMRHYLTVKTGEIPRLDEVYDAFKGHARSPKTAEAGIEPLVKDRCRPDVADFAERDLDLIGSDAPVKWARLQRRDCFGSAPVALSRNVNLSHLLPCRLLNVDSDSHAGGIGARINTDYFQWLMTVKVDCNQLMTSCLCFP